VCQARAPGCAAASLGMPPLLFDEPPLMAAPAVSAFGVYVVTVSCVQQEGWAGVSEADLPFMQRWPARTRGREDYAVFAQAVHPEEGLVGQALFGWWSGSGACLHADSVFVSLRRRRRGIASALYAAAQCATGALVMPSSHQTKAGKGLWSRLGLARRLPAA
jgi:GNAT superfamily N-acetyltransferase